jgi:hypothetical protein
VAHLFGWDCRRHGVAGVRVRETETTATVWCICLACRYGMLGYKSREKETLAILVWLAGYKRNPYFPPSTQFVTSLRTGVTSKKSPRISSSESYLFLPMCSCNFPLVYLLGFTKNTDQFGSVFPSQQRPCGLEALIIGITE